MKVAVSLDAYRKMMTAAKHAMPYEVAGLLYGKIGRRIIVEDADVFSVQSIHSASVNIEADEVAEHVAKLPKNMVDRIIGFWHSHASMSVFHSSIDVKTSMTLLKQLNPLITLTVNSKGDIKAIIYANIPVVNEAVSIEAEVELDIGEDDEARKTVEKLKKQAEKKNRNADLYEYWGGWKWFKGVDYD